MDQEMIETFEEAKKVMIENLVNDFKNTLYSMSKAGMSDNSEVSSWGGGMTVLTDTGLAKCEISEFIEYLEESIK